MSVIFLESVALMKSVPLQTVWAQYTHTIIEKDSPPSQLSGDEWLQFYIRS